MKRISCVQDGLREVVITRDANDELWEALRTLSVGLQTLQTLVDASEWESLTTKWESLTTQVFAAWAKATELAASLGVPGPRPISPEACAAAMKRLHPWDSRQQVLMCAKAHGCNCKRLRYFGAP
jgi:hypothetical protein